MEGNTSNVRTSLTTHATRVGLTSDVFVDAVVGQGYQFEGANGYLQTDYRADALQRQEVRVRGMGEAVGEHAGHDHARARVLQRRRLANGSLAWAFRKFNVPGLSYRDTGVKLPLGQWNHVVVMLDGTAVRTYLNGRLAHTEPNVGDVYQPERLRRSRSAARTTTATTSRASLDELQIFQHGLNDAADRAAVPGRQRGRVRAEAHVVPDRGADPGSVRLADVCVRRAARRRGRHAGRRTHGRVALPGRRLAVLDVDRQPRDRRRRAGALGCAAQERAARPVRRVHRRDVLGRRRLRPDVQPSRTSSSARATRSSRGRRRRRSPTASR